MLHNTYNDLLASYDKEEQEEFIKRMKEKKEFCFLGMVPVNDEYESYLFLIDTYENEKKDNSSGTFREVLILNVRQDLVSSIVNITTYSCFWGDCFLTYTIKKSDNTFVSILELTSSDAINSEKKKNGEKDQFKEIKFKFDEQGYVEVIDW